MTLRPYESCFVILNNDKNILEWYSCCIWFQSYTSILSSGHIIYCAYNFLYWLQLSTWLAIRWLTYQNFSTPWNPGDFTHERRLFFFRTDIRSLHRKGEMTSSQPKLNFQGFMDGLLIHQAPGGCFMSLTHNVATFLFGLRHDISRLKHSIVFRSLKDWKDWKSLSAQFHSFSATRARFQQILNMKSNPVILTPDLFTNINNTLNETY